jgi:WD40 repeat protein
MFPPSFEFDREFHGHEDDVRAICANSEGQNQFATTSRDKTVRIWYLNGDEEADVNECKVFRGHSSFVTCIFWAPQGCLNIDEDVLISGSRDHRILVWSVSKGIVIEELNEHTMDITSIVVLMNGDIITASQDSQICIWRQFKLFKVFFIFISLCKFLKIYI